MPVTDEGLEHRVARRDLLILDDREQIPGVHVHVGVRPGVHGGMQQIAVCERQLRRRPRPHAAGGIEHVGQPVVGLPAARRAGDRTAENRRQRRHLGGHAVRVRRESRRQTGMGRHLPGHQVRIQVGAEHTDAEGVRVARDRLPHALLQRHRRAAVEADLTLADLGQQVVGEPEVGVDLEGLRRAGAKQQRGGDQAKLGSRISSGLDAFGSDLKSSRMTLRRYS